MDFKNSLRLFPRSFCLKSRSLKTHQKCFEIGNFCPIFRPECLSMSLSLRGYLTLLSPRSATVRPVPRCRAFRAACAAPLRQSAPRPAHVGQACPAGVACHRACPLLEKIGKSKNLAQIVRSSNPGNVSSRKRSLNPSLEQLKWNPEIHIRNIKKKYLEANMGSNFWKRRLQNTGISKNWIRNPISFRKI